MDILTLLRTILRRWLVVVPIILLTAAAAFSVESGIKPEYRMAGTVLLASETGQAPPGVTSVTVVTAPVLAEILRSAAAVKRMTDAGAVAPYVIEVDPTTSILRVTATGRDGPPNIRTVEVVLDNLNEELRRLEVTAEVPDRNRATVRVLSRPGDQPGAGLPTASGSAFLVPAGVGRPNQYAPSAYTGRVLAELMLAAESRRMVSDRAGGPARFTLAAQQRDAAPILSVTARGLDPRVTEATFEAVVSTTGDLLDRLQVANGIEPRSRTRLVPLNTPAGATQTSGTVVKSVATVVGLGLIAAATAAILVESLVAGRAERRRGKTSRRRRRGLTEFEAANDTQDVASTADVSKNETVQAEPRQTAPSAAGEKRRRAGRKRRSDSIAPGASRATPTAAVERDPAEGDDVHSESGLSQLSESDRDEPENHFTTISGAAEPVRSGRPARSRTGVKRQAQGGLADGGPHDPTIVGPVDGGDVPTDLVVHSNGHVQVDPGMSIEGSDRTGHRGAQSLDASPERGRPESNGDTTPKRRRRSAGTAGGKRSPVEAPGPTALPEG